MKTVKLKLSTAVTLADQLAPLGVTPSGAVVFEITGVPDSVSIQEVRKKYHGFCGAWNGRVLSFSYAA